MIHTSLATDFPFARSIKKFSVCLLRFQICRTKQMNLSYLLATVHILTFGIGFYGIWSRANALKKLKDTSGLREVFKADNIWGLAALLWIATGLWRAFGGLEKGSHYYLHSNNFFLKMCLFFLCF